MADLKMQLSKNYMLGEFLRSDTAERSLDFKQAQQNPPQQVIDSLKYLVEKTLQPIREKFNFPIRISSGYRCPEINKRVGGSSTSQHVLGEAADCSLDPSFLTDPKTDAIRQEINEKVKLLTGRTLRTDINANFYLFAYVCLNLEGLDIDQVIHEYGEGFGDPAWVHIASSKTRDRRQILAVGQYTRKKYLSPTVTEALAYGI